MTAEIDALRSEYDFTNPSRGRPVAEPPIFDYNHFVEENGIPSDARLRRLLPANPALRTKLRDKITESSLSHHYFLWATHKHNAEMKAGNTSRAKFYEGLEGAAWDDWFEDQEVEYGSEGVNMGSLLKHGTISFLQYWEFYLLDEDGGTTKIRSLLPADGGLFPQEPTPDEDSLEQVKQKYGHLVPSGYLECLAYESRIGQEYKKKRVLEKEAEQAKAKQDATWREPHRALQEKLNPRSAASSTHPTTIGLSLASSNWDASKKATSQDARVGQPPTSQACEEGWTNAHVIDRGGPTES